MSTLRKHWLLLAGLLAFGWWFFTGDTPLMIAHSIVGRGKRLGTLYQDSDGNGTETVDDLVAMVSAAAGRPVARDACLLAVASASEHANAYAKEKTLIQRVIMNEAANRGVSIESQITSGKGLGRQDGGRYCSSVNGPWEDDLACAEGNLAGTVPDDSGGAKHFVHKTGFSSLARYRQVCADWFDRWGVVPVDVGDVSSLRIFLPADQVPADQVAT